MDVVRGGADGWKVDEVEGPEIGAEGLISVGSNRSSDSSYSNRAGGIVDYDDGNRATVEQRRKWRWEWLG